MTRNELYSKDDRMLLKSRMKECGINTGDYYRNHSLLHESLLIYRDYIKSGDTCTSFANGLGIHRSVADYRVRTARIALRCMIRDVSDEAILQLNFLMKVFDCDRSLAKLIYENIGGA